MTQEVKLRRHRCNYQPENARFLLECDFSKQYFHYYRKRLEKTRPFLEFNCRSKWDETLPIYSLAELASIVSSSESQLSPSADNRNQCIIIGTIFKRMRLQPDVIEELSKGDYHVKCERYVGHYTSPDDYLVLEDADETMALVGNIDPKKFVTGIVVALKGEPIEDGGRFLVHDICYAEPNKHLLYNVIGNDTSERLARASTPSSDSSSQIERPLVTSGPVYLMAVSGLGFHPDMGKGTALTRALQNMIDFIWGGAKYLEDERSSRVARILVIGGNLSEERLQLPEDLAGQDDDMGTIMKQSRQVKHYSSSIQAVKHMDEFFAQLSKTIDVDVMPGASDPSSHLLPQQSFHPCMFPKSCMFSSFNCTTNPHQAIYNDNIDILATSGQNIDIISKFSELSDPIEIMKCHLKWGNLAPSAPDNLYSVPYEEDDPNVIDFIPEVYLAGCQDSYKVDYYNYTNSKPDASENSPPSSNDLQKTRTLLITIPRFCETFSCVLINLRNLDPELISFK